MSYTDAQVQAILDEYIKTAEDVYKRSRRSVAVVLLYVFSGLGIVILCLSLGNPLLFTAYLLDMGAIVVTSVFVWASVTKKESEMVREALNSRPGFDVFYGKWKEIKGKQELKKSLAVAQILTSIGIHAAGAATQGWNDAMK